MRPYRYDIVGSFLRPDYLKDARAEYAEGTLSADQLREVEDKAIKELVEKEKAVGLKAVTDGELRRRYWHLDFLASLVGVKEIKADHWSVAFKGQFLTYGSFSAPPLYQAVLEVSPFPQYNESHFLFQKMSFFHLPSSTLTQSLPPIFDQIRM